MPQRRAMVIEFRFDLRFAAVVTEKGDIDLGVFEVWRDISGGHRDHPPVVFIGQVLDQRRHFTFDLFRDALVSAKFIRHSSKITRERLFLCGPLLDLGSNAPSYLSAFKDLDLVTGLNIIIVLDADSALGTRLDFTHIVFKTA